MEIIALNNENITTYQGIMPDIAENIGRVGYYGIGDAQGNGALVWKQSSATGKGEILYYASDNAQTADELLAEYESRLSADKITKSGFELPVDLGMAERNALEKKGYVLRKEEGKMLNTTISYLAALPVAAKCELPQTIVNIGTLSVVQFYQGICNRKKIDCIEDAQTLSPAWFEPKLSCCVLIEGKVCGYLLIHRLPFGALRPELFYIMPPAARHNLLDMIQYVIFKAEDLFGGQTQVIIPRFNENIRALTDKLMPELRGETVIAASKEL